MFGVYIFMTQYRQLVLGLSPLAAGLATAPSSLAFVVGSLLAPRATRRLAPVQVLVWGLIAAAAGFGLMLGADSRFALAFVVVGAVMSLGLAPVFTVGNDMIITAAPPERAGAASALSGTSAELSGAFGVAVFGSIGMVLYRQALARSVPGGVPAEAAEAASATLGGAVSAAAGLPAPVGGALLDASRAAFTDALQAAGVGGAMVVLAAAVIAGRILARR